MILNLKIFERVVEAAKVKSAGNASLLGAIDRAVHEIHRTRYWAYDAQTNVLRIKSITSGKLYIVDDHHTCEATTICKHKVARRLMQRYAEAVGLTAATVETKRVQNRSSKDDHQVVATVRATVRPSSEEASRTVIIQRTAQGYEHVGGIWI